MNSQITEAMTASIRTSPSTRRVGRVVRRDGCHGARTALTLVLHVVFIDCGAGQP